MGLTMSTNGLGFPMFETTKIEFKFEPTSYSTGESIAYASSIILLLLLGFVSYKELKLKTEESIEE